MAKVHMKDLDSEGQWAGNALRVRGVMAKTGGSIKAAQEALLRHQLEKSHPFRDGQTRPERGMSLAD